MKLYKVTRTYGTNFVILELCWADNEEEVYPLMSWEKKDNPPLVIKELVPVKGCCLSVSIK